MTSCDVASVVFALAGPVRRYCGAACQRAHWDDHKVHCSGCAYDEKDFETKMDAQIARNTQAQQKAQLKADLKASPAPLG